MVLVHFIGWNNRLSGPDGLTQTNGLAGMLDSWLLGNKKASIEVDYGMPVNAHPQKFGALMSKTNRIAVCVIPGLTRNPFTTGCQSCRMPDKN